MKKMTLMALALVGTLASCGGGQINDLRPPTTNWQLAADVTDANTGETLKQGTYVICYNVATTIVANVSWQAGTDRIDLLARGLTTGEVRTVASSPVNTSGGNGDIIFTFGRKAAPLSLDEQGIKVNPITRNVRVLGYTNLGVQGYSGNTLVFLSLIHI